MKRCVKCDMRTLSLWVALVAAVGPRWRAAGSPSIGRRWWDGPVNGERVLALSNFRVDFKTATKRIPSLRRQGYHAIQVLIAIVAS